MTTRVVALTIDDNHVKLLVAERSEVKRWASLALEPGLVKDGLITNPDQLAQELQELLIAQGVKEKDVIVGLSGLHCLYRVLTLPNLPKSVYSEAIRKEAERQLPVPLDELYISWQVISRSKQGIRVFLAACPRNVSNVLMDTLKKAGIQPVLMDLTPLALARVADRATAIIANTRSSEADIVIMVDGIPEIIRGFSLPTEAVSINDRISAVEQELERTIKFYDSNNPEKTLGVEVPIYICGELGDERESIQSKLEGLGHPVRLLPTPLETQGGLIPTQYMVNIGLALRRLPAKKKTGFSVVNLNIIPGMYKPKSTPLAKILAVPVFVLAIFTLVPLVMKVRSVAADSGSLQMSIETTKQTILLRQNRQKEDNQQIASLQASISKLNETNKSLAIVTKEFDGSHAILKSNLETAVNTLPGEISLTKVNNSGDVLTVSGKAPLVDNIISYVSALEDSNQFSNVLVASIKQTQDGDLEFTLRCQRGA